jgi:hypothetical protein
VADRVQFGPRSSGSSSAGANYAKKDSKEDKDEAPAIEYPEEQINPDDIPF